MKAARTITRREEQLLKRLYPDYHLEVTEVGEREFDLHFKGVKGHTIFGWLPLGFIRQLVPWTSFDVAFMTDYPEMAAEGDWSGVRDSSEEKIWAIFNKYTPEIIGE